ncbi:MAG: hypothetical protein ACHP9W_07575 [Steroidobacterales bacterium]
MRDFARIQATVLTAAALGALAIAAASARADVTTQESMSLDAAGIVKMHGTTVERSTADKQRKDSEFHCDGLMSLLCGNNKSGDITRLDRALEWQLHPDKKSYLETPLPTPEERAAAQAKMQERLDQIKQCQQQQQPQKTTPAAADTSKCDLSPPKLEVKQTDQHVSLAGHDTRKSSVTLTQTCTDRQTGDVCELVYGFDVWLTSDELAGAAERRAFQRAYMKRLGLDENNPAVKSAAQQFLAQYAGTMKELSVKAGELKGYPLRTTFRFSMGGEHCGKAKQSSGESQGGAEGGGGLSSLAAQAGGKLLSGMFSKKSSGGTPDPNQPPAAAPGAAPSVQIIAFTVETTGIDTATIPAEQFELPAGWTPEKPKASKSEEFTCPASGK